MSKKISSEPQKENSRNSLLPLYLFMILKEESSPEKPLTRSDIAKSLKQPKYDIEVGEDDRKTIPRCIRTLSKYFQGAIVENEGKKGKLNFKNAYKTRRFLHRRNFRQRTRFRLSL